MARASHILFLALLLSACGGEDKQRPAPKKPPTGTQPNGVVVNAETGTAGPGAPTAEPVDQAADASYRDLALASFADAVDALTDELPSSATRAHACATTGSGAVQVAVTLSGASGAGTETRTWTPPAGQTLACAAADQGASLRWSDDALFEGLTLAVEVDKRLPDGATIDGARTVTYAKGGGTDATYAYRSKKVVSKVTRTAIHEVAAKAPLVVEQRLVRSDGSLKDKRLVSGIMTATLREGLRVETSFHDLFFDLSASSGAPCRPTRGTVLGRVVPSGSETALRTFVLRFGKDAADGQATIAFGRGGAQVALIVAFTGCDLEREL